MRLVLLPLLAVLGWSAATPAVAAEHCRFSAPRNAEIDAAGLAQLKVKIGSDDLAIRGEPGLTKIVVHGTACASKETWLADLQVESGREGDTARIIARPDPHGVHWSLFGDAYAYLKLDVRVPQDLAVKLTTGSGDVAAGGLASLDAVLGSGDLEAQNIVGELILQVGSGDVDATAVGSLRLTTLGSGDLNVDGVQGAARLGNVGSGDLDVRHVGGDLSLDAVGSGDVRLADIHGDVKIGSLGSGDLGIRDVGGKVDISAVASGGVAIQRVGGSIDAAQLGSGDLRVDTVRGDLHVGSIGSGSVSHHDVRGTVSVPRK